MSELIEIGGVALLGSLARSCYGLYKALVRGERPNKGYFITTLCMGALIGGSLAFALHLDFRVAGAIGYVSMDFLENVLLAFMPQSVQLNKT